MQYTVITQPQWHIRYKAVKKYDFFWMFDLQQRKFNSTYLEPDAGALGVVALHEYLLAVVEVVHLRLVVHRGRGRLRGDGRHGAHSSKQ